MVVLLGAILAAQWFSSTADGFLEACGNAVVWPMLVWGVVLALLALPLLIPLLAGRLREKRQERRARHA